MFCQTCLSLKRGISKVTYKALAPGGDHSPAASFVPSFSCNFASEINTRRFQSPTLNDAYDLGHYRYQICKNYNKFNLLGIKYSVFPPKSLYHAIGTCILKSCNTNTMVSKRDVCKDV